jgi:hypothetical protein
MSIIIKFIVASEENAHRVSKMAIEHYTRADQQKDIHKEYSVSAFLNSANSFTREWLMSFNVTGEDEDREEQPLAFMELLSAHIPKEAEGAKPLYIEKSIYATNGEGLKEVLNRAIEIAKQRRHDMLWAEIPKNDAKVKEVYAALGFEDAGTIEDKQLLKKAV